MATLEGPTPRDIDEKESEPVSERVTVQYPPQDGGIKAWLFLIGASIVEITAWGSTPVEGRAWLMNMLTDSKGRRLPLLLWCFSGVLHQP
jgi:hypothetical protein